MFTKLISKDGNLYLNDDAILLVRYPAGDCDTIHWPKPNEENLRSALYDEFEMGNLQERIVLLPNGKTFHID